MIDLLKPLKPKERRGSKPRCHLFTHGAAEEVASRLRKLAEPFSTISASDSWMPQGFVNLEEAQLHKAPRLLNSDICKQLHNWWLAPASERAMTPNFDIASTCTIDGKPGLLLVEAKAHDEELNKEAEGRRLTPDSSNDRKASHEKIGKAIASACSGLEKATGLIWQISRDSHYQMSNRFAWAWKLTELGVPVVLVYLGFLRAEEMKDRGKPFADHDEWDLVVRSHSKSLIPSVVWGQRLVVNGQVLIPLIKSLYVPLDSEVDE